jgi:hypothetical protein
LPDRIDEADNLHVARAPVEQLARQLASRSGPTRTPFANVVAADPVFGQPPAANDRDRQDRRNDEDAWPIVTPGTRSDNSETE